MTVLASARNAYRRHQRVQVAGIADVRRARRRGLAAAVTALFAYQALAVREALDGVEGMLAEQRIDAPPAAHIVVPALIGVASDGRALGTLLRQADTDYQFDRIVSTQLADVARSAAGTSIAVRPDVGGYVRMANPGACSRCAILAGRKYRWNDGFERHPNCLCEHVPVGDVESKQAEGLIVDPEEYFESLEPAEQDRIFTKAGAQAIRDGADISRVVNARRGMSTAQVNAGGWVPKGRLARTEFGGQQVYVTSEAGTRRGVNRKVRLMPESIYEVARTRDEAIRLLTVHGYIRT